MAPTAALSTAVDGSCSVGVVAAVKDKQQPLAFGGHRRLLWQQGWQLSKAVIAITVNGGGKG